MVGTAKIITSFAVGAAAGIGGTYVVLKKKIDKKDEDLLKALNEKEEIVEQICASYDEGLDDSLQEFTDLLFRFNENIKPKSETIQLANDIKDSVHTYRDLFILSKSLNESLASAIIPTKEEILKKIKNETEENKEYYKKQNGKVKSAIDTVVENLYGKEENDDGIFDKPAPYEIIQEGKQQISEKKSKKKNTPVQDITTKEPSTDVQKDMKISEYNLELKDSERYFEDEALTQSLYRPVADASKNEIFLEVFKVFIFRLAVFRDTEPDAYEEYKNKVEKIIYKFNTSNKYFTKDLEMDMYVVMRTLAKEYFRGTKYQVPESEEE